MTKPIYIILTLKTWGKRAGCDIRSIGATVFDPDTAEVAKPCDTCKGGTVRGNVNDGGDCSDCMNTRMESGYGDTFYIAVDNPEEQDSTCGDYGSFRSRLKYPLNRDPETVKWWSDQSPEAQAAFADPVDLRVGLIRFATWLFNTTYGGNPKPYDTSHVRLYAHGPQFDGSILEAAYHACQLPVPWHYRAPRDTRTVFDIAGIEDHSGFMAMFSTGTHHHALDDAICQARAVCAAFKVIRS